MSEQYNGRLADPEWRKERARAAGRARQSVDARIAQLEREWPNLTEAQRARVRALVADPC